MNKLDLILSLRKETGPKVTKDGRPGALPQARVAVEQFFSKVSDALAVGERVELRGLCSFFEKNYKSYVGRNPRFGSEVKVPSKRLPFFKYGLELKERVNGRTE